MDQRQFEKAISVLEREQRAYLPSPLGIRRFRRLSVTAGLLAGFLWVRAIYIQFVWTKVSHPFFSIFEAVAELATLFVIFCTLFLFALNLSLLKKLWRNAILRRHLGLKSELTTLFKRQANGWRRTDYFIVTAIILAIFLVALSVVQLLARRDIDVGGTLMIYNTAFAVLTIALMIPVIAAFLSVPLMRRELERLAFVQELRATLGSNALAEEQTGGRSSGAVLQQIAEIERDQIVTERQRSLQLGTKGGQSFDYIIRHSRAALEMKAALDAETDQKVERQIFALIESPQPEGVGQVPNKDSILVTVPGTDCRIEYQVDKSSKLIKILAITRPGVGNPGGRDG